MDRDTEGDGHLQIQHAHRRIRTRRRASEGSDRLARLGLTFALVTLVSGCRSDPAPEPSIARREPPPVASEAVARPTAPVAPALDRKSYAWLDDATLTAPRPTETLHARFPAPEGFTRRTLTQGSFGAWLRGLPLAQNGTPVRTFRGDVLHPASDPRIASVIAIDIGRADLQQCADAVMRFHAEWKWSNGQRDMSYRAAAGTMLPFERWARGERITARGMDIAWTPGAGHAGTNDHASFRKFMDSVFAWANTVSLEKQAKPVTSDEARPGDFFILPGNPGHAVLILDIVERGNERLALLGQSYMPAQSPQVLSHEGKAWFSLDPSRSVTTPFWRPFPWSSLRRLD